SARFDHAMAYDTLRKMTVLFGGNTGLGSSGETWEWDGQFWAFRSVSGPPPQSQHVMAFDEARGVTVLVAANSNQTWEWNGTLWTLRSTSGPSARTGHAITYDVSRRVCVLFGGQE